MNENQKEVYLTAISHYGIENQVRKTIEECSELIRALSRFPFDYVPDDHDINNIIEEIADVQIMIHQMSLIFDKDGTEKLKIKIEQKTLRLSERIKYPILSLYFKC